MGRDELLKQKKEYDEAIKEVMQKHKDPASIKYDVQYETGSPAGYVEYTPKNDTISISADGAHATFSGKMLKSLRDALNKILDE